MERTQGCVNRCKLGGLWCGRGTKHRYTAADEAYAEAEQIKQHDQAKKVDGLPVILENSMQGFLAG